MATTAWSCKVSGVGTCEALPAFTARPRSVFAREDMNIRDANRADIPKLAQAKKPAVIYEDRIRDAADGDFRYLVLEDEIAEIMGHVCLVFRRPKSWPTDEQDTPYPRRIDLVIRKDIRGRGL